MQYQKNKLDISEPSSNQINYSNSNLGEMAYMNPIGNQIRSSRSIVQTVENDLRDRLDIDQLKEEESPIKTIIVNMPRGNNNNDTNNYSQMRSPRNTRNSKEKNVYNIKTVNPIQKINNNNNYQTSTNPQLIDSRNMNINSSNDSGQYHQFVFDPKIYIRQSKSPKLINSLNDNYYNNNIKSQRGGKIPLNNMSPNLNNYEDINSSERIFDENNINNMNNNKKYNNNLSSNYKQNIPVTMPPEYNTKKLKKLKYSNNNVFDDEINNKYTNRMNQSISPNDIKKIMKRFTRIYDPLKNSNGMLIESSQVVVPGASDDIFTNRYKVLSKMNRLSTILLSKKKKSLNKYQENTNLNKRSLSRSKSPKTLSIKLTERARSTSPYMNKMPHNKFLFVSLAMISTKGPNVEDRIILRRMRMEKGGVVDLAQEERKKQKYKIKKIMKNKNNIKLYHTNPKYREIAAKIIQEWWKELKLIFNKRLKKIILIQSVFRGKWVRKNMYDLLYLNYLYICFCRKIEKVLSNNVRPYVFDKLYIYKKGQIDALKNIIKKQEKKHNNELMSMYLKKWYSFIKQQNKKDKLGKQLVDIRSHKENKLNILLAFFNKWRYMTKISNLPPGKSYNIYPLNKLNGLCKIMDAAKKYIQKKALCKIIKQLIKYLSAKVRENLLNKIITKKGEYIKNILRNNLYLWYSKILKFKKVLNEQEEKRLREIRIKIFKILLKNIARHLNERILRKYLMRIYYSAYPEEINKYVLYEILRKINTKELSKKKEMIIKIQGKKYKLKKIKKDLKIIKIEEDDSQLNEEDKENKEQIGHDYEKIIEKINKRKSGEFKEGE